MIVELRNTRVHVTHASDDELAWIARYLSYEERTFARARGAKAAFQNVRRVSLYDQPDASFPAGFLPWIKAKALERGGSVDVYDKRATGPVLDPLADLAWLRDYQLEAVDAAIEKQRGIMQMPTGCLTGDTVLVVNRGGAARPVKLSTLVSRLSGEPAVARGGRGHGRPVAWDLSIPTFTQSMDDKGSIRLNRVVRGWSNGVAPVYAVTTEHGRTLRATSTHRFITPSGEARLSDLTVGDTVFVASWAPSMIKRRGHSYPLQPHMWNHPYAQITISARDGRIARVPTHRLVAEAHASGVSFAEFVGRILLKRTEGLVFFDPRVVHVHHKDRNKDNFDLSNLEVTDAIEHLRKHGEDDSWRNVTGHGVSEKIASIEHIGDEPTFDLEMADPWHNYVANEFVVHNSGKTEVAIGLMRRIKARWLFLVHRADIVLQSVERTQTRAAAHGLTLTVGAFGGGRKELNCDVTFATFQSLTANERDPRVRQLLEQTTGLIIDEVHVAPADSYMRVINRARNAFYRIGMSGTPLDRTDQRSLLAVGTVGPIIYKVSPDTLVKAGVLAKPCVRMLELHQDALPSAHNYQKLYDAGIVNSPKRNACIVHAAKRAQKPMFIFVRIVSHGKALVTLLEAAGLRAEFAWGAKASAQRKAMIDKLTRGDLDVIVCSVVFQEGVDVPSLLAVINAGGMKSAIATIQRAGRGMRMSKGKTEFEVWDVLDTGNNTLNLHSKARRAAYKKQGYEVVVEKPNMELQFARPKVHALDQTQLTEE